MPKQSSKKFLLIFGPMAVGKMSVGRELAEITDLKLFHNHMTIELVLPFFNFGTPAYHRLVRLFRREIFKEVAKSDLPGLIFTYVWNFKLQSEKDYIESICKIFRDAHAEIYFVELESDLEVRLERNKTAERLEHKPSKRNLKSSEAGLLEYEQTFRMNTLENELKQKNYLKINNTHLPTKTVAAMIKDKFKL